MISRLIILLLIVGCAPKTTTNYYIGISEQEFIINNPNLSKYEITTDIGNHFFMVWNEVDKTDTSRILPYFYIEENVGLITRLTGGRFKHYTYLFNPEMDTLTEVRYGPIKLDK